MSTLDVRALVDEFDCDTERRRSAHVHALTASTLMRLLKLAGGSVAVGIVFSCFYVFA